MVKKSLLALPVLLATDAMMQMASADIPSEEKYFWGDKKRLVYKTELYFRVQKNKNILQVALFYPRDMRRGNISPEYTVFIDLKARKFITYCYETGKWMQAMLCNLLTWDSMHKKKWVDCADLSVLKVKLKSDKDDPFRVVNDYQLEIRKEELNARRKRETDPWDADMALIPKEPKGWKKWVGHIAVTYNYIFYEYSRKGAESGYCTYCEKNVPIQNPRHNNQGKCNCCGHTIQFKSINKYGHICTDKEIAYLLQRCAEGFVIREFQVRKKFSGCAFKRPNILTHEIRRTLYSEDMKPRAYWWGVYKNGYPRWMKGSLCTSYSDYEQGMVYKRTLADLNKAFLSRTGLYEMVNKGMKIDPEGYLTLLKKYPRIEQFAKAGFVQVVLDLIREDWSDSEWRKRFLSMENIRGIHKLLGIDKFRMRRLRGNNGGFKYVEWLQYEELSNKIIRDYIISWLCANKIEPDSLKFIRHKMSEQQVYNYLMRQQKETGRKIEDLLITWKDYLAMAKRQNYDIDDEIVYRAKALVKRHDELVEHGNKDLILRAAEFAEKCPHVDEICQSLTKYEYRGSKYAVIAPKQIEDIILEGETLHHCVGTSEQYFIRIEAGEAYILFLRKSDKINEPYYTLEIEPDGTVRQKRSMYDRQNSDIDSIVKFLKEWQKVIKKRLSEQDVARAENSKLLNTEYIRNLREQGITVNFGDYQGQLLADILEADLMLSVG